MSADIDLVTGAFGFAASHVIAGLLARGRRLLRDVGGSQSGREV